MHPITSLRARHGLSQTQLAHALGVSYQKVWQAERGHLRSLPSGWSEPLREMGEDFDTLQQQHRAWMRAQREGMLRRHQARFTCGEEALAAGEAVADEALAFALENPDEVRDAIERIREAGKADDLEGAREWMREQSWVMRMTVAVIWASGSLDALRQLAEERIAVRTPFPRNPGMRDGLKRVQSLWGMTPRIQQDQGGDHA
jgi:transcriptional regulator with XRE-family HTH domain